MSTTEKEYKIVKLTGPISVVPVNPEDTKEELLCVFLLMGPTGSGKSAFIQSLSPDQNLDISKNLLESVTQEVVCYRVINLTVIGWNALLVDTPGFLDTKLSESRITGKITDTLDILRKSAEGVIVSIYCFQPITDIRLGGSKRDAIKLLRAFVESCGAYGLSVVTTMWNGISSSKRMEDANRRFSELEEEIFRSSQKLVVKVTKFEFSSDSVLSIIDNNVNGWYQGKDKSHKMDDPRYQFLIHNNLLERISNIQQQILILAEDKQNATTPGRENPLLLEVVLRDEKVALTVLQTFLDDLVDIGPTQLEALETLLDTRYDANPSMCLSPWPQATLPPNSSPPVPESLLDLDQTPLRFTLLIPSAFRNQAPEPSLLDVVYSSPNPPTTVSTSRQPPLSPLPPPSAPTSSISRKPCFKGVVALLKGFFKNLKK